MSCTFQYSAGRSTPRPSHTSCFVIKRLPCSNNTTPSRNNATLPNVVGGVLLPLILILMILLWNSMMSWAGGWFFLMASEQLTIGSRSFQLPGLGSYLQAAANADNTGAILLGLAALVALIVLLDLLFWRPLVAWADKFKVELSSGADTPHSPVLDALRRSALIALVNRKVFRPLGRLLASLLDRLQPLPGASSPEPFQAQASRFPPVRKVASWVFVFLLGVLALFGLWSMVQLLVQVNLGTWGTLLLAAFATW